MLRDGARAEHGFDAITSVVNVASDVDGRAEAF
jgi:hypothetical protein